MNQHDASSHIVQLEGRVVVLLAQLECLRRSTPRCASGTCPHAARLAQIDLLKADLEQVLVDLEHAYHAYRQAVTAH